MRRLFVLIPAVLLLAAYSPTDAERARWTLGDMQSWRICFAAYKQDHAAYPEVKSAKAAKALFEPRYIQHLPMTDAWGNPYEVTSGAEAFQVVSAGADGKLDPATWSAGGKQSSFDADAVASNEGRWIFRSWEMK